MMLPTTHPTPFPAAVGFAGESTLALFPFHPIIITIIIKHLLIHHHVPVSQDADVITVETKFSSKLSKLWDFLEFRTTNSPSFLKIWNSETGVHLRSDNNRKSSPEKEVYTTRGASAAVSMAEKPSVSPVDGGGGGGGGDQKVKHVWPKLFITLSNKEKEEDFMAMKGCKPPHRPKKRPKIIQRSLLLVSPGGWLTDVCQERYEVIEKKSTKKRPTGLKYMGSSMDSDSE
ncbi:uncharacterized protein LOC112501518 isoform X2 [Cynara cardunculus var. scolymus]|uniref:uncharacterized protein LOC112501518 isoform X2 n=1 Tax=Cynara cardunculus var. scolymus TaxID=59895 RepID=UPI000D624C15|nr:uncharacterized protein LOC112501518 isoform X2 [Cynara cardunculus var. scolymus]